MADTVFAGSVPRLYERYLVPLIFEPYAADLARRVAARSPRRLLEVAAGTGVVTRQLATTLPTTVEIVATDLNPGMLDEAAAIGTARPVEWRQMDAMSLPFPDESFDVIACQFGVMFFPDKVKAYSEAHRVLTDGGIFVFNVWDSIGDNEFAQVVETACRSVFPDDPPLFLSRTPYGYHEPSVIAADLAAAGFAARPEIETVTHRSRAPTPGHPAIGFAQGTPLRNEIEERDASRLDEATSVATDAVGERFGAGAVDAKIQALVVAAQK